MNRIYLQAQLQGNIDGEEIKGMIDPLRLASIKQTDPNPIIKAYAVGHEGDHTFHLVGMGKRVVRWVKEMVGELYNKIAVGTPIFNGHNPTSNSTANREQLGEVVGKTLKNVGDKVYSIVAVYLKPQYKNHPLDVASIEADMGFDSDGTVLTPSLIDKITGIALGNSAVATPGFPGATLLGTVQAFANQGESMTLAEVKAAIVELKLGVTDLFTVDEVLVDKKVEAQIKETNKDTYNHAKRVETENTSLRNEVSTLKNTHADELKKRDMDITRYKSKDRFSSLMGERKLSDQQKKFAEKNWGQFKSEATTDKAVDTDLNTFIDTQLTEYKSYAEMFGIKVDDIKPGDSKPGDTKPSDPPVLPGSESGLKADVLDPAKNDFIPQPITPGKNT